MRVIPDNSFSILVDITAVYVKFKIDAFILFPTDGGFYHIKPTYTTVNDIKFDIPPLKGKIDEKGTARIFVLPDDKIQELVHMDYNFINNVLNVGAKLTKESEELPIGISITHEMPEEKPIGIMVVHEEEILEDIKLDMKSENKGDEKIVEIDMDLKEDTDNKRIKIDIFYK